MTNRTEAKRRSFSAGAAVRTAALAAGLALAASACGTDLDTGEVRMARASWDSGYMQAAVYAQLIGELGYVVTDPADSTLTPNQFYPAAARGQYDLWANGWFPLHDIYLTNELVTGQSIDEPIEPVGYQVRSGALQGYMIDKATADEMGIASMADVIGNAGVFDRDGDGLADLIGCNEGWACKEVIDEQIAAFGWSGSVEQVVGDYNDLVRDAQNRMAAGESVLFYTWTPNWTIDAMIPGQDVVWLNSTPLSDEAGSTSVPGLAGCAYDPCDLGWTVSSIRAVANSDFLDENPQIRRLLEVVSIPLGDIADQNAKMAADQDYSEEQIRVDAAAWIAANRDMVDGWLSTARNG